MWFVRPRADNATDWPAGQATFKLIHSHHDALQHTHANAATVNIQSLVRAYPTMADAPAPCHPIHRPSQKNPTIALDIVETDS